MEVIVQQLDQELSNGYDLNQATLDLKRILQSKDFKLVDELRQLLAKNEDAISSMLPDNHPLISAIIAQNNDFYDQAFRLNNKKFEELFGQWDSILSALQGADLFFIDTIAGVRVLMQIYKDRVSEDTYQQTYKKLNSVCLNYNEKFALNAVGTEAVDLRSVVKKNASDILEFFMKKNQ